MFEVPGFLGKCSEDRVPGNSGLHSHALKHAESRIYVTGSNVASDELVRCNDIVKLVMMGTWGNMVAALGEGLILFGYRNKGRG